MFELASSDDRTLEIADRVFVSPGEHTRFVDRRWIIERSVSVGNDSAQWIVGVQQASGSEVEFVAVTDSREAGVHRVEADALDFVLANTPEAVAVHGALLSKLGRGIVIIGPSQAGKSTLATALWRAGWSLMADDTAFLHPGDRSAAPTPRRISLRDASRDLVGDDVWGAIERTPSCLRTAKGLFFHPHEVDGTPRIHSTPVTAIFFLARKDVTSAPAATSLINPAKAALALLPYAFKVRELQFMEAVARISPIASTVPSFDLGRGHLKAMIEAVEKCLD